MSTVVATCRSFDDAYDCRLRQLCARRRRADQGPGDFGQLVAWGKPGPGRYITVFADDGHTFMWVDGVWFDTAGRAGPYTTRWLTQQPSLLGYAYATPPAFEYRGATAWPVVCRRWTV